MSSAAILSTYFQKQRQRAEQANHGRDSEATFNRRVKKPVGAKILLNEK